MAEVKKERWLDYLALSTVIFAICATLSTFKGGGYSTRSVLSQEQASDQWNFFQAKSIRESLYVVQKENLGLQLTNLDKINSQEAKDRYAKALESSEKNIQKYKTQKTEIEKIAREFEAKRDDAQKHGQPFGIAVIFFQIAILLCSIAGLFKRKQIWYVALPVGMMGLIYFANGFLLFM
jgi:hypothetical protein